MQTVALYGDDRILFGGHFANTPANPDSSQEGVTYPLRHG